MNRSHERLGVKWIEILGLNPHLGANGTNQFRPAISRRRNNIWVLFDATQENLVQDRRKTMKSKGCERRR